MILRLPKSDENIDETHEAVNSEDDDSVNENTTNMLNISTEKAIEQFIKIRENGREDISKKEIADIEKECEIIRKRKIITKDLPHKKVEITSKDGKLLLDHRS